MMKKLARILCVVTIMAAVLAFTFGSTNALASAVSGLDTAAQPGIATCQQYANTYGWTMKTEVTQDNTNGYVVRMTFNNSSWNMVIDQKTVPNGNSAIVRYYQGSTEVALEGIGRTLDKYKVQSTTPVDPNPNPNTYRSPKETGAANLAICQAAATKYNWAIATAVLTDTNDSYVQDITFSNAKWHMTVRQTVTRVSDTEFKSVFTVDGKTYSLDSIGRTLEKYKN